jgi:glycine oxidase
VAHRAHDAIVCGAGVIGLSLALELRHRGLAVLLLERSSPGHEASYAAAGMLAWCDAHHVPALHALAHASFREYPEFVHTIEDQSGQRVDLRLEGTIQLLAEGEAQPPLGCLRRLSAEDAALLEPLLAGVGPAALLQEGSVDPRALCAALERAARHRGVELATGSAVTEVVVEAGRVTGVRTERTEFAAGIVVNCCGAWSSELAGAMRVPVRPVKGQMLAVVGGHLLRHTIRGNDVYLVPRSDGRLLIGATVEEAGFDKRVVPETIQRLHQAAANLVPHVGEMKMLEAWAGLRPATSDQLPVLGATALPGYFLATGHYRDGVLLAPITAKVMADLITGAPTAFDLTPFSPDRFAP